MSGSGFLRLPYIPPSMQPFAYIVPRAALRTSSADLASREPQPVEPNLSRGCAPCVARRGVKIAQDLLIVARWGLGKRARKAAGRRVALVANTRDALSSSSIRREFDSPAGWGPRRGKSLAPASDTSDTSRLAFVTPQLHTNRVCFRRVSPAGRLDCHHRLLAVPGRSPFAGPRRRVFSSIERAPRPRSSTDLGIPGPFAIRGPHRRVFSSIERALDRDHRPT